ncbi:MULTISPECIES: xanthine dehydrogenase family protein subunit M [unclassified Streptomyces]|uniref:FAD binding domain-containing protein n=1 Tax=unclassified Streptomyces TaxID=2593676 RepID=UPI000DBA3846|nr:MULTISPECIES: xanthine dehydrogenase family protein subunit M [unclassified Streptomyces]MYT72955.1 xanthine dehydrogenase family protein subunit M [Streptomyces sp. SID8367]RAJ78931.1 carbon-monoxide dehydrogenase medium subunit [Streptomyces sp. PsTaAH-137]
MKPTPFDYSAPRTVPEALALLADEDRDPKVVAGGQSLIPMLGMRLARPGLLVDITRIPGLDEISVDASGALHIGAAVRQARAAADPAVRTGWPLLAAAIGHIGHPQIRARGTVCGSLVHHDPAAELPTAALASDARFVIAGPAGTRTVAAADFFVATFQTAVEPDELLTEVVLPPQPTGWAFEELARRHGDFATVGVAVLLSRAEERVSDARAVFCGVGPVPVRLPAVEEALTGTDAGPAALAAAREAALARLDPSDDVHATAAYRREAAAHLLGRACTTAWERTR